MSRRTSTGLLTLQAAARNYRVGGAGLKLTLVVLVESMGWFDHEQEWKCWPSKEVLARETEQSDGTIRRHLAQLQEMGLVALRVRGRPDGGRGTSEYVLNAAGLLGEPSPNAQNEPLDPENDPAPNARNGDAKRANGNAERAFGADALLFTRTVKEREENGKTLRADSASRFEAHFWPAYPARDGKKLDKAKALEQWHKLSIDDQRAAVKGARHYAASGQKAKDAHRWLRDRCFEDWQTPAVPSTNGNGHSNDAGPWLAAWEEVVAGARQHGRNDEPDWAADVTERTVRAVGWGTICESVAGGSGIGPLRAQFRQTWQHHMTGVG